MKKKIFIFTCLIILIIQTGCNQTTEPLSTEVYVTYDIESAFENDFVKASLDDNILIESKVTTDYSVSLAWSSGLQKFSRDGHHLLHFSVIDYGVEKYFVVDTSIDTSSVLIRFNRNTKTIHIEQIKGILLRD